MAPAFLQLASRKDKDGTLVPKKDLSDNAEGADDDSAQQESQPESFITQVSRRDSLKPAPRASAAAGGAGGAPRGTWRFRLRSLLCCLAPPAKDPYYRSDQNALATRPAAPIPPPRPNQSHVLGPVAPQDAKKKTLVLDLDETLVHSSFKPIPDPDYIIPVEIEGKVVDVYVLKRPHMDTFMASVGAAYEVVVFTASLAKYADPLLDLLDKGHVVRWRLFRESCCPFEGNYVKDLLALGRPLATTIIVDNSPHSYVFQPENAMPIGTFIDEKDDVELLDILPILLDLAPEHVDDVRDQLGPRVAALHAKQRGAYQGRHR
mmetsp:Transcript_14208/g.42911  ORF Transcript_14208/g.42911 Transcript_14208/m.42911 type:complete len:319 (+) Transcript_14208:341-1297(+)